MAKVQNIRSLFPAAKVARAPARSARVVGPVGLLSEEHRDEVAASAAKLRADVPEYAKLVQTAGDKVASKVPEDWLASGKKVPTLGDARLRLGLGPWLRDTDAAPSGTPVLSNERPLVGAPTSLLNPKASALDNLKTLMKRGLPRYPKLTRFERRYETQYANLLERQPLKTIVLALWLAEKDDPPIIEVDALKRLLPAYGHKKKKADDAEAKVRLLANHALTPLATLVARLALLRKLDKLAKLPPGDKRRQIFVTSGGCAAGKTELRELARRTLPSGTFGVIFDAAGEGDARENSWVLEAARARGLTVVFGFAQNDPVEQYRRVLGRGLEVNRFTDIVTYVGSYTNGVHNMQRFLDSTELKRAVKDGVAKAIGFDMGPYDWRATDKTKKLPTHPDAHALGKQPGKHSLKASDLKTLPKDDEIAQLCLRELETFLALYAASGEKADDIVKATLGNALKLIAYDDTGKLARRYPSLATMLEGIDR